MLRSSEYEILSVIIQENSLLVWSEASVLLINQNSTSLKNLGDHAVKNDFAKTFV